jgi:hypothetical protein
MEHSVFFDDQSSTASLLNMSTFPSRFANQTITKSSSSSLILFHHDQRMKHKERLITFKSKVRIREEKKTMIIFVGLVSCSSFDMSKKKKNNERQQFFREQSVHRHDHHMTYSSINLRDVFDRDHFLFSTLTLHGIA